MPDVRAADSRDVSDVLALLERLRLPTEGLREHSDTLIVAKHDGRVIGSAALECYSDGALLRSVAVTMECQCAGVGRSLVDAALDLAWLHGTRSVFLLTTTAAPFFARLGFETISRVEVPRGVQTSIEFASACPQSATVMRKRL